MMWNTEEISSQIKKQIETYTSQMEITDFGTVQEVGDGVARVTGLRHCVAGELLEFSGGIYGMAMNLEEKNVGAVIIGADRGIKEGGHCPPDRPGSGSACGGRAPWPCREPAG